MPKPIKTMVPAFTPVARMLQPSILIHRPISMMEAVCFSMLLYSLPQWRVVIPLMSPSLTKQSPTLNLCVNLFFPLVIPFTIAMLLLIFHLMCPVPTPSPITITMTDTFLRRCSTISWFIPRQTLPSLWKKMDRSFVKTAQAMSITNGVSMVLISLVLTKLASITSQQAISFQVIFNYLLLPILVAIAHPHRS